MIGLEPGTNFTYVCLNYTNRQQVSWDFLACEGSMGWPASHAVQPMLLYLFFQHFWLTVALTAFWEALEPLMLLAFNGSYGGFYAGTDSQLETLSGAILGDWFITGTLGLLLGVALSAALSLAPFVPRLHSPVPGHPSTTLLYRAHMQLCYATYWLVAAVSTGLLPSWTLNDSTACLSVFPYTCENIGIVVCIGVVALVFAAMALNRPLMARANLTLYKLAVIWLVATLIYLQNAQPWIPAYLDPNTGPYLQVWLACSVMIVLLFPLAMTQGGTAGTLCGVVSLYLRATMRLVAHLLCCRCCYCGGGKGHRKDPVAVAVPVHLRPLHPVSAPWSRLAAHTSMRSAVRVHPAEKGPIV